MESITLAEGLPLEITRVKELVQLYKEVPNGRMIVLIMESVINRAEQAILDGDTVTMLRAYETLNEYRI